MSSGLVALPQLEVRWSRPEHPLVVGKDILELLTTSMYVDPMCMYREYVQNSADAIDLARTAGLTRASGLVEIRVDQAKRAVFIRDDGAGLGKDQFVPQLTALGSSKKRGTGARGFRGVGRLAGLAFCQELVFRSRQDGEATVHELRWDSREVRNLLRSAEYSSDLRDVVARTIETREVPGRNWPERFFEVELRGVIRHRDDRLLNEQAVAHYLGQVSPVPFSAEFQFGEQIQSFLESHRVRLGAVKLEIAGYGKVYRPHRNSILVGKGGETQFQELSTIYTPGRDGNAAAATWILHHDYRGALPSNSLVEGWRLRCGDIQIGDNALLQGLFPESRFNAWCVAETHVLDARILPNGRRDHFEQNAHYFDLINHLAPQAREIAQRCRNSSIARNLVRAIEDGFVKCHQNLRILEKGTLARSTAAKIAGQVKGELDRLQRLCSRSSVSPEQLSRHHTQIKRLRGRLLRWDPAQPGVASATKFTPTQRAILGEVFKAIYQSADDLGSAQALIDKIVARLAQRVPSGRKHVKSGTKR